MDFIILIIVINLNYKDRYLYQKNVGTYYVYLLLYEQYVPISNACRMITIFTTETKIRMTFILNF